MKTWFVAAFWLLCVHGAQAQPPAPVDNPEMEAIFAEDQQARKAVTFTVTDGAAIKAMIAADINRRARTHALLAGDALKTGTDFESAAYIFQHGDLPADYLLAHVLATVAVAKGREDAIWIAAATLDRYLLSIGQKQILGTQFHTGDMYGQSNPSRTWTQEPYDRGLLSDALRAQLRVPSLAAQLQQLQSLPPQK